MYKKLICICVICLCWTFGQAQTNSTLLFDDGWRFYLGGAQGAESVDFNDKLWRKVDLPHDWSIEDQQNKDTPFNPLSINQVSGGFTSGGTGWYRKTFKVSARDVGKHLTIQFDGVYMNADVWINGKHLGNHPYGYTSFYYDITNYLNFGGPNVIAVEVKNEGLNSRWYSGSGIYRHVWLKVNNPVSIAQWGITISTPQVDWREATVNIRSIVINTSEKTENIRLVTRFLDTNNKVVNQVVLSHPVAGKDSFTFQTQTVIKQPQLWSCETPALYTAVTELYIADTLTYSERNKFGIRSIAFDVSNGFQLNGKTIKLKGGCFHNDNGPLGSRAFDRAEERKVELLKASGFNAIRCSHNPPSPAFLAACDRLGMLVIDEAFDMWNVGKNPYDYHLYFKEWWQRDLKSMVCRDKNHPSIIMWSIGNEIPEKDSPEGVATARMLGNYVRSLDQTRVITAAVNDLNDDKDPFFATLDISGYNYAAAGSHHRKDIYASDHVRVPNRIMFGTESYPIAAFESWMEVIDHPYVIGDFVWTAFDYIGEASLGWLGYPQNADFYPWNLAFCGDIDLCGWKRPQSYYRDALWKADQLSVFVKSPKLYYRSNPKLMSWSKWNWDDVSASWNWEGMEGRPFEVNVYSSCPEAELFLNGKSFGRKTTDRSTKFLGKWNVPYAAGELKVVGYDNGKVINTSILKTAAKPSIISLAADRSTIHADGEDLSYITVQLADKKGIVNPNATNLIKFRVTGGGTIVGVGNANPLSIESDQLPQRKAWKGRCLVIIKSSKHKGIILLQASGKGLKTAQIKISVE